MEELNNENKNNGNNMINKSKVPEDRSSGSLLFIGGDNFLLIGGANREKPYNDMWQLKVLKEKDTNSYNYEWSEIKLEMNNIFYPRFGTAGIILDPELNNSLTHKLEDAVIWLHGGQNYFENKHFADMYQINLVREKETETYQIKSIKNFTNYPLNPQSSPKERNSHTMNYHEKKLYIFGGGSNEGLLNDLWLFNLTDSKWTKIEIKGSTIPPREMHGSIVYTNKQKETFLYIFGGRLYEEIDNKIYRINLTAETETNCEVIGELPSRLCSFSFTIYKQFLILYGGTDGVSFLNDIIILNLVTNRWAKSKIQINSELINNDQNLFGFLGRIGSMMSIDTSNGTLVIFGGSSLHKDNNFTCVISLKELLDENNLCSI
jgi:hypothetical protein